MCIQNGMNLKFVHLRVITALSVERSLRLVCASGHVDRRLGLTWAKRFHGVFQNLLVVTPQWEVLRVVLGNWRLLVVGLVDLMAVDGLETLSFTSNAHTGRATLDIVVITIFIVLIFGAILLLLIHSAIRNALHPISFRQLKILIFTLVIVYLIEASSGKSLIFDHRNLWDAIIFFHHSNILSMRMLVMITLHVLRGPIVHCIIYQDRLWIVLVLVQRRSPFFDVLYFILHVFIFL